MPETAEEALPTTVTVRELRDHFRWFSWTPMYGKYVNADAQRNAFRRYVAKRVDAPDLVKTIQVCSRCSYPDFKSNMKKVAGQSASYKICGDCTRWYSHCQSCDKYAASGHMYYTLEGHTVCYTCLNAKYRNCGPCGGYYRRGDYRDHLHRAEENSCCASPQEKFRVPYVSEDTFVRQDKRVTVQLPAGEISEEGLEQIRQLVYNYSYDINGSDYDAVYQESRNWRALANRHLHELGNVWQKRDGNYTRRLSRLAYKTFKLKTPPTLMTKVGNVATAHSAPIDFNLEFTRRLNLPAREFAHPESCWWQSYYASRCATKTNGGFGIRSFEGRSVTGRAWIFPMKKDGHTYSSGRERLVPTFNTETADAYVVFNGYGKLNGYTPARILSYMTGMTYRKIEFTAEPIYVNSSSGYLVGPEDLVQPYTDGSLSLSLSSHSNLFTIEESAKELTNA